MELLVLLEKIDPMTLVSILDEEENETHIGRAYELQSLPEDVLGRWVHQMGLEMENGEPSLYVVLED